MTLLSLTPRLPDTTRHPFYPPHLTKNRLTAYRRPTSSSIFHQDKPLEEVNIIKSVTIST
jgi:hypothetical protein